MPGCVTPRPPVAAGTTFRLIARDRALIQDEGTRVEDPASEARLPPRLPPCPGSPRCRSRRPCLCVPAATLFVTSTEVSVSLAPAWLRIPPPEPAARPPWMVNFEIETFPPSTSNTRSKLFPSTIVLAPLPLMVRFPRDVEVAGRCRILTRAGERQFEHARGNDNRVGVRLGVGCHDGRA